MAIVPPEAPRAPERPAPASLRAGRIRLVVWLHPAVQVPDGDEVDCTPAAFDAIFGDGMAQRLLITPETAWLGRLIRPSSAGPASDSLASVPLLLRSTPYTHIYVLALTGGSGATDIADMLSRSAAVTLVYPEPIFVTSGAPTKYTNNDIFKNQQGYLKTGTGIDVEPLWAKGYTGVGITAGVVDSDANVSDIPGAITTMRVPAPAGAAAATPSADVGTHARYSVGILGSADTDDKAIGVAPEVAVRFVPAAVLNSTYVTNALVALKGKLKAGDVVNLSLAVSAGLDVKSPYAGMSDILKAVPAALTEVDSASQQTRASAVATGVPVEFDPAMLKVIGELTALGITVVAAAGNGVHVMVKGDAWRRNAPQGADVGARWLAYTKGPLATPLAAYRAGLAKSPAMSLDRSALAAFADGGGIIVSCGYFAGVYQGQTLPSSSLVSNDSLNFGNRLDCCASIINAGQLGLGATSGQVGGTSICAPVIAGAVAVLQSMAVALFKSALKPAVVRALLSDPDLGTTPMGHAVGILPNLSKQMTLLEGAKGKQDALVAAIQAQQTKSAARVKAASGGGAAAGAGGAAPSYVHDPYTVFTAGAKGSAGSWGALPLSSASEVFVTASP